VLTALLLEDRYEAKLIDDRETRWALIREVMTRVARNAQLETEMLIRIHEADPTVPLFALSEKTSEQIFELQAICVQKLPFILQDQALVWMVLEQYIPATLIESVGKEAIFDKLNAAPLQSYRDAIITKKLSAMAFYKYGAEWGDFIGTVKTDFMAGIRRVLR